MRPAVRHLLLLAAMPLVCAVLGFAMLVASFSLSGERMDRNCRRALMQADMETVPLHLLSNGWRVHFLDQDRLSDRVMLAAAAPRPDSLSAAEAAAMSLTHALRLGELNADAPGPTQAAMSRVVPVSYARYWHGYLAWLRPLLALTDARGVYAVVAAVFWLLVGALAWAMWRRGLRPELGLLIVTSLPFTPWLIPRSLIFFLSWSIALAVSVLILCVPRATATRWRTAALMIATGCAVAYNELLATPLVAFTLPMLMLGFTRKEYRSCRVVALLAVAWLFGYGVMWTSKWVITAALTSERIFADAFHSVALRSAGLGELEGTLAGLGRVAAHYAPVLIACGILLLGGAAWALYRCRRSPEIRSERWLVAVAAVQLAWMGVMVNHTVLHYWFTYRALAPVAFALTLFLLHLAAPRLWSRS